MRRTEQRAAVQRVLAEADRPLSASEILALARALVGRIGLATVYRSLRILLDRGHVTVVDLPGEPGRYEVAGKAPHHHFRCEVCDRVFDVPHCSVGADRMTPEGFRLDRHVVVLYGTCEQCGRT